MKSMLICIYIIRIDSLQNILVLTYITIASYHELIVRPNSVRRNVSFTYIKFSEHIFGTK